MRRFNELGQLLRRRIWQPLHRMMEIFHVLPLTAAVIIFFLLATDGQLHEIYISYLEDLKDLNADNALSIAIGFAAAAGGLALIGAAVYEAHYWLSTMRIGVVYSSISNPDAGSLLRGLQRMAAFGLALVPWFGIIVGLIQSRDYLAARHVRLATANVGGLELDRMQHLLAARSWIIVPSIILLGAVVSIFLDRYRRHPVVRGIAVAAVPFAIAALFLLLIDVPLKEASKPAGILAVAGFGLAVLVFYVVYARLQNMQVGFVYKYRWRPDTGVNLRARRRRVLFVWGLIPWFVLALYFLIAPDTERDNPLLSGAWPLATSRWAMISVAMMWAAAAGLSVAMILDRHRESARLRWTVVGSIALLMVIAAVVSQYDVDSIVRFYRLVGPLGTMALGLLFLFSIFALLAILSQSSGFPALTLVVLAIVVSAIFPISIQWTAFGLAVVCAVFVAMAIVSRLFAVAFVGLLLVLPGAIALIEQSRFVDVQLLRDSGDRANQQRREPAVTGPFELWLKRQHTSAAGSVPSPYPAFIIAVEGGGIYAAAAASLFMAKLEEVHPGFSRHVFAISGVSGGAVGATIFDALTWDGPVLPRTLSGDSKTIEPKSCQPELRGSRPDVGPPALMQSVSQVMQDDHFSPVVGAIFPELLGAKTGRAEALAGSFTNSVCRQDETAARALGGTYVAHWPANARAPALVLNSTWVETGFRVAFAPFPLHDTDEALYAFSQEGMPGENHISLIKAAVVSARFPGILPPYSIKMESKVGSLRWNFADGGYSDSSGAATALALYDALKPIADRNNAKLRVILLTSSQPQADLTWDEATIRGTPFRDTIAPIAAVLKVREGLGNRAVARVCGAIYPRKDCREEAGKPEATLKIVEIEDQTYGLPLGWKLSRTTFDVVSWMLGRPDLCRPAHPSSEPNPDKKTSDAPSVPELKEDVVRSNSCVLKDVKDLFGQMH